MNDDPDFQHTGRVIRDEIRISAPPEAIYAAWSDPERVTAWFVGGMQGSMEPGETVRWYWDDSGPGMVHEVIVADAPHRLVTRMELPQGASFLEVTIEQEEGHSLVRLVQSGFGEGPDWDDEFEGMLSGWMIALALLKFFAERYLDRRRREIVVLDDASFEPGQLVELQRTAGGLARWLSRSGSVGRSVGEPVSLVLENGMTLTGTILRTTRCETLWSWDEIEGVVEIKAFRAARWGSKVGIRISSWMDDPSTLAELEGWLTTAVGKLADALAVGG